MPCIRNKVGHTPDISLYGDEYFQTSHVVDKELENFHSVLERRLIFAKAKKK